MADQIIKSNPFPVGEIVFGDKFIGRSEELELIERRVSGSDYSPLAIIGLPRMGKTSLVWEGVMTKEDELIQKNCYPIFITPTVDNAVDFYTTLVKEIHNKISLYNNNDKLINLTNRIIASMEACSKKSDVYLKVKNFFLVLKRSNLRIILIIDEFDHVEGKFDSTDFLLLRTIAYDPNMRINLITTSRKRLHEIEKKDESTSTFEGITEKRYIGTFNKEDQSKYWDYCSKFLEIDESYKFAVTYFAGYHPWLMNKINHDKFENKNSSISSINDNKLAFMEMLDSIIKVLEQEQLLDTAMQLVIGPVYGIDDKKLDKLAQYTFLINVDPDYKKMLFEGEDVGPKFNNGKDAYICFSQFSSIDLYNRYRKCLPYAPLWDETENCFRDLIKRFLSERFSQDWINDMKNDLRNNQPYKSFIYSKWETNLTHLINTHQTTISVFPQKSNESIINFTITSQIVSLFISPYWDWFKNVFKGNRNQWFNIFNYLNEVRHPVAHNNTSQLDEELKKGKEYCILVQKIIKDWMLNN